MKKFEKMISRMFALVLMILTVLLTSVVVPTGAAAENEERHYLTNELDETLRTDNEYANGKPVKEGDPHFGWTLSRFYVTGFTTVEYEDGVPVFLVNAGDELTLGYELHQDINALDGNAGITINDDKDGCDTLFNYSKSVDGFGHGALLVKQTNVRNSVKVKPTHMDYLSAAQRNGTAIAKQLGDGDYEVALDYEIAWHKVLNYHHYTNYRVSVAFKVRNSNCMVFARDINSNDELADYSIAQDGFFLDMAGNEYLNVTVRREIITGNDDNDAQSFSLTTRFCRAAKDRNKYEDVGVYTVTASNRYTDESVTKVIGVGQNELINAYVVNKCEKSTEEIMRMVEAGEAYITDDWQIEYIPQEEPEVENVTDAAEQETVESRKAGPEETEERGVNETILMIFAVMVIVLLVAVVILIIVIVAGRKSSRRASKYDEEEDNE